MSTFRVPVSPSLFAWALKRSGKDPADFIPRFPELHAWLEGTVEPKYSQLEQFAAATHTPFGDFFLPEPPVSDAPIPDFRTPGNQEPSEPSVDLLETIFICEQRQEWYHQHALLSGTEPLPFVGSQSTDSSPTVVAGLIGDQLQFTPDERGQDASWTDSLRRLIDTAEEAGILVMVSGIVGHNTRRSLDPAEFRGFALSDGYAPLIFINGADAKAAQIFTLVHEVCHLWLGQSALTDSSMSSTDGHGIERWCSRVAAEVLVPSDSLRRAYAGNLTTEELERLAKVYKVSTLVVLKSMFDTDLLTRAQFKPAYDAELDRVRQLAAGRGSGSGGDFYNTHPLRVSRRFAKAIISDTKSGQTPHRDAYRLLGTRKHQTFTRLGERVGVT